MSGHSIVALRADAVQAPAINSEIEMMWRELRDSGRLARDVSEAGIDPAMLDLNTVLFAAVREESQFGIAETLLIALATGAASQAGKSACQVVWERVIWPRLSRHFGAALEPEDDRGSR